jgi:RND family efflux transporter MFP subunit
MIVSMRRCSLVLFALAAPVALQAQTAAPPARVVVARVEPATIRSTTDQPGLIEPAESTALFARVPGYVSKLHVDIGDRVRAGQLLAEIDVPDLAAEQARAVALERQAEAGIAQADAQRTVALAGLESAEAGVASAEAAKRRTVADRARWEAESPRVDQLVREGAATSSLADETLSRLEAARAAADEAEADFRSATAEIAVARARIVQAEADRAAADAGVAVAKAARQAIDARVGFARIVAPFDGVIVQRAIDTGFLTEPGGAGTALFEVARVDVMTAVVGVPEADAVLIQPGDRAEVRLVAGGTVLPARVSRTSDRLDPSNRTLRVEIDLPNPDQTLRAGLFAHALIVAEERAAPATLPVTAILGVPGSKPAVFVIEGGKARRREVTLGISDASHVEILSGLAAGDQVANSGLDGLSDGQAVTVAAPTAAPKP